MTLSQFRISLPLLALIFLSLSLPARSHADPALLSPPTPPVTPMFDVERMTTEMMKAAQRPSGQVAAKAANQVLRQPSLWEGAFGVLKTVGKGPLWVLMLLDLQDQRPSPPKVGLARPPTRDHVGEYMGQWQSYLTPWNYLSQAPRSLPIPVSTLRGKSTILERPNVNIGRPAAEEEAEAQRQGLHAEELYILSVVWNATNQFVGAVDQLFQYVLFSNRIVYLLREGIVADLINASTLFHERNYTGFAEMAGRYLRDCSNLVNEMGIGENLGSGLQSLVDHSREIGIPVGSVRSHFKHLWTLSIDSPTVQGYQERSLSDEIQRTIEQLRARGLLRPDIQVSSIIQGPRNPNVNHFALQTLLWKLFPPIIQIAGPMRIQLRVLPTVTNDTQVSILYELTDPSDILPEIQRSVAMHSWVYDWDGQEIPLVFEVGGSPKVLVHTFKLEQGGKLTVGRSPYRKFGDLTEDFQ